MRRQKALCAVAHHAYLPLAEQLEAVVGALGTQFLDGADQRVGQHHAQKQHVAVAAYPQQQACQTEVEQVEKGHNVAAQNIGQAAIGPAGHGVGAARFPAGAYLVLRKSMQGNVIGMHVAGSLAAHGARRLM